MFSSLFRDEFQVSSPLALKLTRSARASLHARSLVLSLRALLSSNFPRYVQKTGAGEKQGCADRFFLATLYNMKLMIWIGMTVGGLLGGWLGSLLDNGNFFGAWGIIGSTIGGILGVWIGYRIGRDYL